MNKNIRLQGDDFKMMRSKLTMFGYEITERGSIKALFESKDQKQKKYYYHWLSNEEINRFIKSRFFQCIEPFDGKKEWAKEMPKVKKKTTVNNTKNDKAKAFELMIKHNVSAKLLVTCKDVNEYDHFRSEASLLATVDFKFLKKIIKKEMENQNEKQDK